MMRPVLTAILPLLLLLASPVFAQNATAFDKDGCIALAVKMDASAAGKRKASDKEQTAYDECVVHYNCYKVDATTAPPGTYDTSVSQMRYLIQVCGEQK